MLSKIVVSPRLPQPEGVIDHRVILACVGGLPSLESKASFYHSLSVDNGSLHGRSLYRASVLARRLDREERELLGLLEQLKKATTATEAVAARSATT